jgi:hypothetical protein
MSCVSLASSTATRIGQLIRLLSSPMPGEAGAAAQALNKTLASAGVDIHQLATVVETGFRSPQPIEQQARRRHPPPPNNARRPDGRPLKMGETLVCDQADGVFRPCGCGGIRFRVMAGVGPHLAQLRCDACGRKGRWLSRQHFGANP